MLFANETEIETEGRQNLAELVVHFLGKSSPLFFLGFDSLSR